MANPYSPSFRPILSNPLASALQGLATGGMQGYQMVEQSRQRQADNAFRAKQLQNQQDELQLRQLQAGYTPPGVSPLRGSGSLLGMANAGLGASTGALGLAGVLPQTDVVANQPAHLDFQNSSEGQRLAAELRNQTQMAQAKNANDVANLHLRFGETPGQPGLENAAQYQNNASLAAQRAAQQAADQARLTETQRHNRISEGISGQNAASNAGRLRVATQLARGLQAERLSRIKSLGGGGLPAWAQSFILKGVQSDEQNSVFNTEAPFDPDASIKKHIATAKELMQYLSPGASGDDSTDDNPEEP